MSAIFETTYPHRFQRKQLGVRLMTEVDRPTEQFAYFEPLSAQDAYCSHMEDPGRLASWSLSFDASTEAV